MESTINLNEWTRIKKLSSTADLDRLLTHLSAGDPDGCLDLGRPFGFWEEYSYCKVNHTTLKLQYIEEGALCGDAKCFHDSEFQYIVLCDHEDESKLEGYMRSVDA